MDIQDEGEVCDRDGLERRCHPGIDLIGGQIQVCRPIRRVHGLFKTVLIEHLDAVVADHDNVRIKPITAVNSVNEGITCRSADDLGQMLGRGPLSEPVHHAGIGILLHLGLSRETQVGGLL